MVWQLSSYHLAVPHYWKIIYPGVVNPGIYGRSSPTVFSSPLPLAIQILPLLIEQCSCHQITKLNQSKSNAHFQTSNLISVFLSSPSERRATPDPELTWHRSAAPHLLAVYTFLDPISPISKLHFLLPAHSTVAQTCRNFRKCVVCIGL